MAFLALLIGAVLVVAALRGTQGNLFSALAQDIPGFVVWGAAIFALSLIGFVPGLKPISRGLIALVIVVIVLKNYQAILAGFQGGVSTAETGGASTGTTDINALLSGLGNIGTAVVGLTSDPTSSVVTSSTTVGVTPAPTTTAAPLDSSSATVSAPLSVASVMAAISSALSLPAASSGGGTSVASPGLSTNQAFNDQEAQASQVQTDYFAQYLANEQAQVTSGQLIPGTPQYQAVAAYLQPQGLAL